MAEDVKIPGIGPVKKKTVYIVGAVFIVAVGVYYYRSRNAAAAVDTTATDTTDTTQIDPATGYAYGTVEDQAALASQQQYNSVGSGAGTSDSAPLPATPTGFTSNAQWTQAAEEYLSETVGLDSTQVQAALGKYITGGAASTAQATIIEQAIAAEGYPPIAGPNGYPPSVRTAAVIPTPTPTKPLDQLGTPHIYVTAKGKTGDLRIHWNAIPHAGFYLVSGSNFKTTRVTGNQHPNILIKPPSSVHVKAYPVGYSNTGQRVKYVPYLASDSSNTLTARKVGK